MAQSVLFARLIRTTLAMVYLVIVAGSVVRMTGSGMGCPDWPFCFGYAIPPTDIRTVTWAPDREFEAGQMILYNDQLWVAQGNFITEATFRDENWEVYTQHDYAHFNPVHTWVEYINRLIGAATGIPALILALISLFAIKRSIWFPVYGLSIPLVLGFEAWLGKTVVDGNLVPHQITIHMLGAIALVFILFRFLAFIQNRRSSRLEISSALKYTLWTLAVVLFAQIVAGTQVREEIDAIAKLFSDRSTWVENLSTLFIIHRSTAPLLMAGSLAAMLMNHRLVRSIFEIDLFFLLIWAEALSGVILAHFDLPKWNQPIHLVLAVLAFGTLLYSIFRSSVPRAISATR